MVKSLRVIWEDIRDTVRILQTTCQGELIDFERTPYPEGPVFENLSDLISQIGRINRHPVGSRPYRGSSPLNLVEEFSCCRGIEGLQGLLRFERLGRVAGMEITDAQAVVDIDRLRIEADRLLILRDRFRIALQLVI